MVFDQLYWIANFSFYKYYCLVFCSQRPTSLNILAFRLDKIKKNICNFPHQLNDFSFCRHHACFAESSHIRKQDRRTPPVNWPSRSKTCWTADFQTILVDAHCIQVERHGHCVTDIPPPASYVLLFRRGRVSVTVGLQDVDQMDEFGWKTTTWFYCNSGSSSKHTVSPGASPSPHTTTY